MVGRKVPVREYTVLFFEMLLGIHQEGLSFSSNSNSPSPSTSTSSAAK
jgi:hypothetical protein